MTDLALMPTLLFLAAASLASWSCLAVCRTVPWQSGERFAQLRVFFALACAPFIAGMACVIALGALPGAAHWVHGATILVLVSTPGVLFSRRQAGRALLAKPLPDAVPFSTLEHILAVLIALWWLALMLNSALLPLTQNDALEYLLVGRELFSSRSLWTYPVLEPATNVTGFYGPWTHPPLYVAMIYGANISQGHAELPGVARLIAPWFLTANVLLIYGLARFWGRTTALFAALLFISTPLYFLGAGSALLDALPILGLTLVLAAVVGAGGASWQRGIVSGIALALALWGHSQSILIVPLAVVAIAVWAGLAAWRQSAIRISVTLLVAAAISIWPYLRNVSLFGSPVSDNPLVFRIPSLGWADYFRMARGIETVPDIVQYGVFKGWFAPEAYSVAFWFMTLGLIIWLIRQPRGSFKAALIGRVSLPAVDHLFLTFVAVFLAYQAGLILSVILGIDLLIRNERYLLILMPVVVLITGAGLHTIMPDKIHGAEQVGTGRGRASRVLGAATLSVFFLLQFIVIAAYRLGATVKNAAQWPEPPLQQLAAIPFLNPVLAARCHTPADSVVLSMKPADMFYASRKMVSYLDPRLIPFYAETDTLAAYAALRRLGISFVQVPEYTLPPYDRSALARILMRPDLSTLVSADSNNQLYALGEQPDVAGSTAMQPMIVAAEWTKEKQIIFGGRKALARLPLGRSIYKLGEMSEGNALPFFRRETSVVLTSRGADVDGFMPVRSGMEYFLSMDFRGLAQALVAILVKSADGSVTSIPAGDITLTDNGQVRSFLRRFTLPENAVAIRISVEHRGAGHVVISRFELRSRAHTPPVSVRASDACFLNFNPQNFIRQ